MELERLGCHCYGWFSASLSVLPTLLRNPTDCSPPGSCVHEIFQGYWSRLPFPSPEDLPDPGIEPGYSALQADSMPTEIQGKWFRINYLTSLIRRFHIYKENNSTISQVQKVKNLPANPGDPGSIPGSGRSKGNSSPPQWSCLENSKHRGG